MNVLDLFSAAAGGWSLGMHRAGFQTMAACENVAWRRALYQENNPNVLIYDDVCTLTADRLIRDLGYLPDIVVGSPPCQDISSANTKGKGVEGERSGLYFEAIRIIGECRPRWFGLENSANLRTRGADAVLAALEALGYTVWAFVVGAGDVGANHERKRSWLIGFDPEQITDAGSWEQWEQQGRRDGPNWSSPAFHSHDDPTEYDGNADGKRRAARVGPSQDERSDELGGRRLGQSTECGRNGSFHAADAAEKQCHPRPGLPKQVKRDELEYIPCHAGNPSDSDQAGQAGQADGCMVAGVRQAKIADDGRRNGWGDDGQSVGQMGRSEGIGNNSSEPWAGWNSGLAGHLRVDDGLSAWVAGTRVAVGGPKGTSSASLIVEAFGDSVVPQIPEAIGRAIIRTETALRAIYARAAA